MTNIWVTGSPRKHTVTHPDMGDVETKVLRTQNMPLELKKCPYSPAVPYPYLNLGETLYINNTNLESN